MTMPDNTVPRAAPGEPTASDLRTYAYWAESGRKFRDDWVAAHAIGEPIDEPIQYIGHLSHAVSRLFSATSALEAQLREANATLAAVRRELAQQRKDNIGQIAEIHRLDAELARKRNAKRKDLP